MDRPETDLNLERSEFNKEQGPGYMHWFGARPVGGFREKSAQSPADSQYCLFPLESGVNPCHLSRLDMAVLGFSAPEAG